MAMRDDLVLDHIVKNGVEYIHMANIDNILQKCLDPFFIGFA